VIPAEAQAVAPTVQHLFALRELAGDAAALDPHAADGDDAAIAAIATQIGALLGRVLALFAELQAGEPEIAIDDPDLDALEPDAWAPSPRPRVADVCFAAAFELRRAHRELAVAASAFECLVAAETGRRKLRRAIRAVLEAAREDGVHDVLGGEHVGHHQVADVASGLAVRRLYAKFRRALRDPTDSSPEAVLAAVRYAGGALATLVTAPDYADVRASDRAVLRNLRERALAWARSDRGVRTGLHLLEDVRTCGDLMRGINRRQELRAHDRALLDRVGAGPHAQLAIERWLDALDPLFGLDDALDDLLARASTAIAPAALVGAIVMRLEQVRT
jgi:hypothetical protein